MAKNADFISHKKSKQIVNGKPKLPEASALVEGEIAINFGKDVETLSIKNESGNVVTFSSDNYYTEQKLGSGFTGENSGRTVTEALENIDITVDQVLDNTTSASTNPISSKAVYKSVTDNELVWTNAFIILSGSVSAHTEDTDIHVTAADKTAWNAKADISDIPSVSGYADSVKYNSTTKYVEFYHGTTAGTKVFEYDASPFIIDGMVQNVEIKDVQSGDPAVTVTCLVVSFNTDAGKQDINIPISQIFDANNYYTKSETSGKTEISNALGGKVNTATFTGHTADTTMHFTTTEKTNLDSLATNIAAISGITATKVSNWDGAASNSHTHSNKTALDSITGNVGTMAYENASSYSSATQVNTALGNKVDKTEYATFSAATNTSIEDLSGQSRTVAEALVYLNQNKQDTITFNTAYNASTNKAATMADVPSTSNFQTKITANGILKGDGNGGVSAATAGTDYQAPLSFMSTPTSSNKVATANDIPSSLPANGGNAATVSGHTVLSDVPSDADFTNTWRPIGTGATDACAGNDSRLSDSRVSSNIIANTKSITSDTSISSSDVSVVSGGCESIICVNQGSADYTVTFPNQSITIGGVTCTVKTPDNANIEMTCLNGGYCEVNIVRINNTLYVRGA